MTNPATLPPWANLPHVTTWLSIMQKKDHFSWHLLAGGKLTRPQLLVHYQQEQAAYVKDFPVLLGRVLGHGPPDDVRRALAANIYEEQTGGLSGADAHPALFVNMMAALGFDRAAFVAPEPLPTTAAYRAVLEHACADPEWFVGYAVMCIFVEGSAHERISLGLDPPTAPPLSDAEAVAVHPLVRHYGVAPQAMTLTRAHHAVEGGHRQDAWEAVVKHVTQPAQVQRATQALQTALASWLAFRDGVAAAMGVTRP